MKCGIVDVGSNTIRLSIYHWEGETFKRLMNKKEMAGLADSLLLLSRLDAGRPEQPPETVDVAEQVRRAFTVREPRWREKELTLALSLGDAKARGYGPLLAHVWSNLVDNAVK